MQNIFHPRSAGMWLSVIAGVICLAMGWQFLSTMAFAICILFLQFVPPPHLTTSSADKWQGYFQSAPAGMAIVNINGNIIRANAALAEIYGLSLDEIHKVELRLLVGDEAWDKTQPKTTKLAHERE
ncbi:MAG: PAS domain S-box protein, partial [Pseudomonadales bacterium]|nr:PAS domain S-box protein [Pseudomonadales bacterium]